MGCGDGELLLARSLSDMRRVVHVLCGRVRWRGCRCEMRALGDDGGERKAWEPECRARIDSIADFMVEL